jgi:hypothetical protein
MVASWDFRVDIYTARSGMGLSDTVSFSAGDEKISPGVIYIYTLTVVVMVNWESV